MPEPVASLRRVSRLFPGGGGGLGPCDLDVTPGEMVVLLGPSGCGKSTLLRILAGLETSDTGTASVNGGPPGECRSTAFILQDPALLPWLTVRENASLLLRLNQLGEKDRAETTDRWLDRLGLAGKASQHPWSLSGGERMRVSLARALGLAPKLFLFDEPFAALDEMSRESLQEELNELRSQQGWAGVFVTHSVSEAAFLADRVVILGGRPGLVKQIIPVGFPSARDASLRTTPAFSSVVAAIREALRS